MVIKVGINGFGRVGRVVFRKCLEHPDVEVCAINDPAIEVDYICYLMKYDSTHGTLKKHITHVENEIIIDDLHVRVFHIKNPSGIPWHSAGAEYVVEASGMFTSMDKASGHLVCDGVKRVIVTAPCMDVPILIFGVNETKIKPDRKVVSCGSSTLYCLAPMVKLLEDLYGLEEGFCTSIHAMTPSLKPLDGLCLKGNHWRDYRSITQNIIPAATGACKALGRLVPAVRDRVCGLAFRVPVANVSVLDLTVRLKTGTSLENIVGNIEKFNETTKNIMRTNTDDAVSSDFAGDSCSCILDLNSSFQLGPNSFKLVCWYENEYSYACRVVDLIIYSEKQFKDMERFGTNENSKVQDVKDIKEVNKIKTSFKRTSINETERQDSTRKAAISTISGESRNKVVCKIWNDDMPRIGHKPTVFFHSFAPLPCAQPERRLEEIRKSGMCTRAHERLEKVKQEFSKMVHITETLLKKSNSTKLKLNSLENTAEINKADCNTKSITSMKTVENSIATNNSSNYDINCNLISSSTTHSKDVCHSNLEQEENKIHNEHDSDISMATAESVIKNEVNHIKNKPQVANVNNNIVAKTFTDLCNGLTNLQFQFSSIKTYNVLKESKDQQPKSRCESLDDNDTNENLEPELVNIVKPVTDDEPLSVSQDVNGNKLIDENATENEIDEPKTINVATNAKHTENNDIEMEEITHESHKKNERLEIIDDQLDIDQRCGDYVRPADSCSGIKHGVRGGSICVDLPNCESVADSACASSKCYGEKRDIYDKLDSGSGSNNSFDIDQKKSEVINITDLTSSLEDLDRLDKICRIMEISDELSDRLFSELKNTDGSCITKKRWSFKDLCEKVNLDEFCTKVFGK